MPIDATTTTAARICSWCPNRAAMIGTTSAGAIETSELTACSVPAVPSE